MRHQAVIKGSWFMTICTFSILFGRPPPAGLRLIPSLHNSHKQTTAGRRILSTCSLTLFDVLRNMIVLQASQVLHQSSSGTGSRTRTRRPVVVDERSSSACRATLLAFFCLVFRISVTHIAVCDCGVPHALSSVQCSNAVHIGDIHVTASFNQLLCRGSKQ